MKRIKEKPELKAMAKRVLAAAESLERGQVLTHQTIEGAAGIKRYSEHWTSVIKKVKNGLLDTRSIAVLPVPEVGYKLCTLEEQVTVCSRKRRKRAFRQIRRGRKEVGAVPPGDLPMPLQIVRSSILDSMRQEQKKLLGDQRRQAALLRKPDSLPR